jgi:hypothetical protein
VGRGRQRRGREPYRSFLRKVEQAKAQARLKAEMAAMENDPRFWLKNGPGRDVPGKPGWAAMVRPILNANQQTINLFTSPAYLEFRRPRRLLHEFLPPILRRPSASDRIVSYAGLAARSRRPKDTSGRIIT